MTEEELKKFKEKIMDTTTFPSVYMFKFIVPSEHRSIALVESLFDPETDIHTKESGNGKYTSITGMQVVVDVDEIMAVYKKAADIKGIMFYNAPIMQTTIYSDSLKVTINYPGAEICSIKNNSDLEFIWQAHKAIWARHAPVLFPIVGRLKDNLFLYNKKKHGLAQHGFARDAEFELMDKHKNSCTFQLTSNAETKEQFPFDFVLQIQYSLTGNQLTTAYKVINPSASPLLFSIGAHPGFNCPLLPEETFEDYYLEFENDTFKVTQLNNGLLSDAKKHLVLNNKKLPLTKNLFDNDALVFQNNQIDSISLCSSKSNHKITLNCKDWPYFGIWTKKENGRFICLEPWYGVTDHQNTSANLEEKKGIIYSGPQTEFNCQFSLIFS